MMENIIIIIGFIWSAIIIYLFIQKILDIIFPTKKNKQFIKEKNYKVVMEDTSLLKEVNNCDDNNKCIFYQGTIEEIKEELIKGDVDMAIINKHDKINDVSKKLKHIKVKYYAPMIKDKNVVVYPLNHHIKYVDIFYRNTMKSIVSKLLKSGEIIEVNEHY